MRSILADAVREQPPADGLFTTLLDRFGDLGGVELELPPRQARPRAVDVST